MGAVGVRDLIGEINFQLERLREGAVTTHLPTVLRRCRREILRMREEYRDSQETIATLKHEVKWLRKQTGPVRHVGHDDGADVS